MLFSRARCHYCGSKSQHSKKVREFQCEQCEAMNFFDGNGNVVDAPATITSRATSPTPRPQSISRAPSERLEHQQQQSFCRTCTQNQLLYNETLANYLPDESHPEYKKYERAIPKYKKELEKRYPLVCTRCAAGAQSKINRADYYGMTQHATKLISETKRRGGMPAHRTRDDWGKKFMRLFLNLIGLVLFLGLCAQIAYHVYAILTTLSAAPSVDPDELSLEDFGDESVLSDTIPPTLQECAKQSLGLRFTTSCFQLFGNLVPYSLAIAAAGLFYNPGIKAWYHHTKRFESVKGQTNYFYMQLIVLVVRSWAWFALSDPAALTKFDKEQLIAMHGFAIFFILVAQAVANRGIEPVLWKIKGKIMPLPDDVDILGQNAGPAPEHFTPKASEKDPWRYLRRQDPGPFDINSLAPQYAKAKRPGARDGFYQQPSPEYTDSQDDEDAMETDERPVMRSQSSFSSRPNLQPLSSFGPNSGLSFGFNGGMREELFGVQDRMRQEEAQRQQEMQQQLRYQPQQRDQSPFHGSLPPAPMSMERRLRNPIIRPVEPERVPLSQQKNFMQQMRAGVKPVQFPQRGSNFELKQSNWVLPSDVKEIGLEDRFQKTFSLADPAPDGDGQSSKGGFFGFLGL